MVQTGLERWLADGPSCAGLAKKPRYGLLAHPASIDHRGRHSLESLAAAAPGLPSRLFAPEHGLWGHEQDMESVGDAVDPWTGLPVVSLYGTQAGSLRPSPETLDGLDAIVVDLQDVGSRYYTFIYTMAYTMEAAEAAGIPVVVLDRPNPIGGEAVEGPVLEPGWESFVGRYPIPVQETVNVCKFPQEPESVSVFSFFQLTTGLTQPMCKFGDSAASCILHLVSDSRFRIQDSQGISVQSVSSIA